MSSRKYFFFFRLSGMFIHLIFLSGCFLALSWMVTLDAWSPFGEEETSQVFVPKTSEAAQRGYALPGEGNEARVTRGRDDLSTKLLYIAAGLAAAGILVIFSGTSNTSRSTLGVKSIFGSIGVLLLIAVGGCLVGFAAGLFLVFLPTNAFLILVPLIGTVYLVVKWIQAGKVSVLKNNDPVGYPVKIYYDTLDFDKHIDGNTATSYEDVSKIEVIDRGSIEVSNGDVVIIDGGKLSKP